MTGMRAGEVATTIALAASVALSIALMAEAREAHAPKTMTMMGGPIDARKSPTAVNNLAMTRPLSWFERHVIHRVPAKYPGSTGACTRGSSSTWASSP